MSWFDLLKSPMVDVNRMGNYVEISYIIENKRGFIEFGYNAVDKTVTIYDTEVPEEFRGQGHGRALYEIAEKEMPSQTERIILVPKDDTVISFWEKMGFEVEEGNRYKKMQKFLGDAQ